MSVLILQGPRAGILPPDIGHARDWAGHVLRTVRCQDVEGLAAGLRAVRASDAGLVVLEGGELPRDDGAAAGLREALDQLPVPYIELHAASGAELEPWLHPRHLPMATVVSLYDRARGYALSRSIAVRRLGAARHGEGTP